MRENETILRPSPTLPPASHVNLAPNPSASTGDIPQPLAIPTRTSFPCPLTSSGPWLLAYDSDVEGDDEIYLVPIDGGPSVNLTQHPAEDRYPAWSPDGTRLAFQSNREGNWDIYVLDWQTKALTRLTFDPAYDGAPTWSPDGKWIAFESYRDTVPCDQSTPVPDPPPCPDLEIYRISAQGGLPQRLTESAGGDYQPAWSPDGAHIAFTSWRDGDKEIYLMPAPGGPASVLPAGSVRNLSARPGDDWAPTWSPDSRALVYLSERDGETRLHHQSLHETYGSPTLLTTDGLPCEHPTWAADNHLLYTRYDPGLTFEVYDPYRPGAYHLYRLSPYGGEPQPLLPTLQVRHPAIAPLAELTSQSWDSQRQIGQAQAYVANTPPQQELVHMEDVIAPDPRLVSGVSESFQNWRAAVRDQSGHDFLGQLSDVFRPAAYYHHRLGYLSWHKTGRAIDLLFDWHDAQGQQALYVMREDLNSQVYWRLFLKCTAQDGSMGAPLPQAPWHFWWHTAPPGQPEMVPNGGQQLPIPPGYFIDVTALAERYGWSRIASYHLDDFHWQRDSTATEYWHYQHTDSLTWYQAMEQIYPPELLESLFSRTVAASREQSASVMDGKGLPPAEAP